MPSLSDLPGNIKTKHIIKALQRLGFIINKKGGKGSHIKITWPATQKSLTIPKDCNKNVQLYIIKEAIEYSHLSWEDIKKEF